MDQFRFLHAADIHLDSPLIGLERYDSAPIDAIRGATRRAFENLIQLAIDEGVAFVLLAGDLYDGDWKDYRTGLFFVKQMAALRQAGIPAFIVCGNHDAASQLTKSLRPPDNVHFLSTRKPETHLLENCGVAVHGQGFATRAVSEDLAAAYPQADRTLFNIGLLHTSLDGRPGHDSYAPTSLQALTQKGYEYWALGHVHKREVVSKEPWVVFPGNLQGRHARETGPKGCTLVTVDNRTVIEVVDHPVDVLRWASCDANVDGATTTSEVLDRIGGALSTQADLSDGRPLAVRVGVFGAVACHGEFAAEPDRWIQEVRGLATGISSADIWVEKVHFATNLPVDLTALASRDDALGGMLREIVASVDNPDEVAALRESLSELRSALPEELLTGADSVDTNSPELLSQLGFEARDLLMARIARDGGSK